MYMVVEFNSPRSDEVVDSTPIKNHRCTGYAVNGNLGVFFVQEVPDLVTRRNIALGKRCGVVLLLLFACPLSRGMG
jgi:hypothetical protein